MPFLLPILALLGVGAAVYVATRPAATPAPAPTPAPQALTAAPQPPVNPQTGPQTLTRDQKIAFFKLLPQLTIDAGPSATSFDAGTLVQTSQMVIPGDKTGPALDILYRANMTGHAILIAKNGDTTAVMVPAVGTEASFAQAQSNWFVVLSPNEADAIASAAGVTIPASAKIAPSDPSDLGSSLASSLGDGIFRPVAGNPFRNALNVRISQSAIKLIVPDDSHLDWTKLPADLLNSVQLAVNSGVASSVLAWADATAQRGYTTAAGQLYQKARDDGWGPSDADHPALMTFSEMIAPNSHSRIQYQDAINSWTDSGVAIPAGTVVVPDGWVDSIQASYNRALTAPLPGDDNNLRSGASFARRAGYAAAADELDSLANTLSAPPSAAGAPDAAPSAAPDAAPSAAPSAAPDASPSGNPLRGMFGSPLGGGMRVGIGALPKKKTLTPRKRSF